MDYTLDIMTVQFSAIFFRSTVALIAAITKTISEGTFDPIYIKHMTDFKFILNPKFILPVDIEEGIVNIKKIKTCVKLHIFFYL